MNPPADSHGLRAGVRLCRLDAVTEGDCLEVRHGTDPDVVRLVVMRSAGSAWAYVNACPHQSLPLNARPNTFLITGDRQVMCAYHCAVFRFEDGLCIDGPAYGRSLAAVPVRVVDGEVIVA